MNKTQKSVSLGILSVSNPEYVFLSSNGTVVDQKEITRKPDEPNRIVTSCIDIMDDHGITMTNIDQFIVLSGPGSLTGIRVGLSPIRAWSYVTGRPITAISSLETLVYGLEGKKLAMIPARRDHYWIQPFNGAEIESPQIVEISTLAKFDNEEWTWVSTHQVKPEKAKFISSSLTPQNAAAVAATKKALPWMKALPTYLFEMDNGIG